MLPLYDENPSSKRPVVTWSLIGLNVVVFAWEMSIGFSDDVILKYGEIPLFILNGERLYSMFTSMFLHANIAHIFGNMLYLFIFGDNVEDTFGHTKYAALYVASGIAGGLVHSYIAVLAGGDDLLIPAIGASGAISGVLGAYLVLFPRVNIVSLVTAFYFWRMARIPAIYLIGFWFVLQFLYGAFGVGGGVAYWAHIGGFLAGAVSALLLKSIYPGRNREASGY